MGQVFKGYYNAGVSIVEGVIQMVVHPVQTAQGVATAAAHPVRTAQAIAEILKEKSQTLEGQGEIAGDILIGFAGGAALKAATKSATIGKLASGLRKITGGVADDAAKIGNKLGGAADNAANKTTAIGRMDDLKKFDKVPDVDTWRKSGRVPEAGDPPVTWRENRDWLDERIGRGDDFGVATDPSTLPPVKGGYLPGQPNGYFTARELEYLRKLGIDVRELFE